LKIQWLLALVASRMIAEKTMRHRRRGRKLGRNPKHQRALLRNLASALFITERDAEFDENAPKVKGRIVTTIAKAKEVRPLVEKCITIACRSQSAQDEAASHESTAERGTEQWKAWRNSEKWHAWNKAIAPAVTARRRCLKLLGDKQAVGVLFDEVASRFVDRPGGYTRIIRLAQPRLGDAGTRAILEFVGVHDRVVQRSEKPAFDDTDSEEDSDVTTEEEAQESVDSSQEATDSAEKE
jgi:large subunit ribosomal protein L17